MTPPLAPEVALGDRYVLTERIAGGGMGEVWRARDNVLGRTVAVKVLRGEFAADPEFLERFRNEAKHTAALSHPGIANTFDYGEFGDAGHDYRAYLVMECVDGEPLSALLARSSRLPPGRVLDIVGQAGLALQAAHDVGVVHRDVKPANLLLRPDGVVKVTDFGIARAVDATPLTQTGIVVGTAAYLSPEQAAGKPVTAASDIYSLGVVAYECLAGHRPFTAEGPIAIAMAHVSRQVPPLPKDVPPLVADFVLRALDKDPARRQPSAGDFGRTALALSARLQDPTTVSEATSAPAPTRTSAPTPTRQLPAVGPSARPDVVRTEHTGFDDAQRRRVRNAFIAIGTVVVVVGFLLLHSCGAGPKRTATAATPRASTTTPAPPPVAAPVQVRGADYIGQRATLAVSELHALGLHVREQSLVSSGPAGTVVDVTPTGTLARGSTVTLTVAAAPPAPTPKPRKHGKGGGHGGH